MKNLILYFLLTVYTNKLRFIRTVRRSRNQGISILIIPPGDPGSLGDEAMMTAILNFSLELGAKRVGLISWISNPPWELVTGDIEICHHFIYGSWQGLFQFAQLVSRYDRFYCPGADVMDGYYSEQGSLTRVRYAWLADRTGASAAILGFSFNNQPKPSIVQAFRALSSKVRICARDPVSDERLIHHLKKPVELVADLAFLLQPAENTETLSYVREWTEQQHKRGQIIIGVNANSTSFRGLGEQVINNIDKIYVKALTEIYSNNQKCSFVLIPHDFRDSKEEPGDVALSEAILKSLPREVQSHCIRVKPPFSAAEIKAVCANLDIVLTGRMHLAIACLGQGTPPVCISYQGKMEGLFKHFELEGMLIEPQQAVQPGSLSKSFIPLIEQRERLHQHILLKLPKIQQLARANFE